MLRTIQTPHLRPIVSAGQVITAATPSATINIGAGDYSAVARNSAGKATLTRRSPQPIRPGIVIGSPSGSIANGGYFTYDTDPSSASIVGETLGAAGSGDDGNFDFLAVDYRSAEDDRVSPLQTVVATSHGMRWIVARITAAGAISYGHNQIASVSLASSIYTITYKNAFARTPLAFVCPVATTQKSYLLSRTASTCTVSMFDASEAAENNAFHLIVVGWDRTRDTWGMERAVQVAQRKPRLECFRVNGTGTAAIALGSTDAALTDNGTGDYTLTWTKPFAFAPVVIPVGKAGRAQLKSATSSTAANIVTFGATGSAADDEFCALVMGFDCVDEQ